jgi:hypothetical protein
MQQKKENILVSDIISAPTSLQVCVINHFNVRRRLALPRLVPDAIVL